MKQALGALRRKLVVVGDSRVGKSSVVVTYSAEGQSKTCLLMIMSGGWFPEYRQNPKIAENYVHEMEVHGRRLELLFCDTEGQEYYDRLRPLSYPDSAVILITFAIDDTQSFKNITLRWAPEVLHYCSSPKVPILLVGCKTDLRRAAPSRTGLSNVELDGAMLITHQQGTVLAAKIGAVAYLECSAKYGEGVMEVLMKSGEIASSWDPQVKHSKEKKCLIL